MLVITEVSTKQLDQNFITVSWVVQSTQELLSDYVFNILKIGVETDDLSQFLVVASGINPQTIFSYNDPTVAGITSKFVDYFYKIQISGLLGQGVSYSDYGYVTTVDDRFAREIERRRGIVFNFHSGTPHFLLKRREYGTYCPKCYDPILQRTTASNDTTCYATGFLGGYFGPVVILGQLQERPIQEHHTMFSAWQDQDAVFYTTPLPTFNPKDVLVDKLARRWLVINANNITKNTHGFAQVVQIRQIEHSDVAYKFPVTY